MVSKAKSTNLPCSTKHSVEILNFIRGKELAYSLAYLDDVINLRKAIPFKRFKRNVGHKKGMAAGRYPIKAAKYVVALLKSAQSNAKDKGMGDNLVISKAIANRAARKPTGSNRRGLPKRTHLELELSGATKK